MDREQLGQLLSRLRAELATLEAGDDGAQTRLRTLLDDIEGQLADHDNDGLTSELKRRIETFEVEHPRVTAILNDVMVTLSNLGI